MRKGHLKLLVFAQFAWIEDISVRKLEITLSGKGKCHFFIIYYNLDMTLLLTSKKIILLLFCSR